MSGPIWQRWLRGKWKSLKRSGKQWTANPRPARISLRLEELESRLVPAAPSVLSIARTAPVGPITNASTVTYTVNFNEAVTGVTASDFEVTTDGSVKAASPVTVSGKNATFTVAVSGIHGNGDLQLDLINNGTIIGGGLPLDGSFQGQTYHILQTFPSVVSINRTTPPGPVTSASSVVYTVTFSEPVTGVVPADFQLAMGPGVTGTVSQVTPSSGAVYSVTVSGITGTGPLGLNLVDNGSIQDLAGNPLIQQNAPAVLTTQQGLPVGSGPQSVVLGSLTGDGKLDLVVATYATASVSVLLGNGNGTFQAPQTFATGVGPIGVALGDVNGDGKPDLVVTDYRPNAVSVLLGNGNGTFQAQHQFTTGYGPTAVAVQDVNGDGKPDLVVANYKGNTVSVLLGNGNGTFQAPGDLRHRLKSHCGGGGGCERRRQTRPGRRQLQQQHGERALGQRQRHLPGPADLRRRLRAVFGGIGRYQWRRQTRPGRAEFYQQHGERAVGQRQRHLPGPADLRHRFRASCGCGGGCERRQ